MERVVCVECCWCRVVSVGVVCVGNVCLLVFVFVCG